MARTPTYVDIPVPHDLDSAIAAIKALKQVVEALTGSTAQANGRTDAPANTGAVARVWVTRKDEVGAPAPVGLFDGDLWYVVPNGDGVDTWVKLIWYRGGWVNTIP